MSFIDTCTEMLISAIKNGSVYKQYCTALKAVNKIPGLKEQVDDLRRMNYRVQNEYEDKNLYEVIDDLDTKMEELCKIEEVNQFLEAELALCKQLQGSAQPFIRVSIWMSRNYRKPRRVLWENKSENRKSRLL